MTITRRGLCSAALVTVVGGCLDDPGGSSDGSDAERADRTESTDGTGDGPDEAADDSGGSSTADSAGGSGDEVPDDLEEWTWSGTLPVDSVVQHYNPICGCCSRYIAYLELHDIDVRQAETTDLEAIKERFDVPTDAWACHTVEFGDYLVEGHVPLEAIETLLEEEPDVAGISAPGMPDHSPGMGPRGEDPLQIYAFQTSGEVEPYVEV